MTDLSAVIASMLDKVRQSRPLVHHITNFVVMNDTANVTLHIGALPVMAQAQEEVADMVSRAGSLLLNLGTPSPERVASMLIAGRRANTLRIPIVLDPVGVGATPFRTDNTMRVLEMLDIAIVRGNLAEMSNVAGIGGQVRGVESVGGGDPVAVAHAMALRWGLTAAITGARDIISDGQRTVAVNNGHEWLTTITGSGCMSTAMVAAFAAVGSEPLLAAAAGLTCLGLAAELAADRTSGPGSFKVALFDALYHLSPEQVRSGARVEHLSSPGDDEASTAESARL
jgi:hydroxyethylthiazole kinase